MFYLFEDGSHVEACTKELVVIVANRIAIIGAYVQDQRA